MAYDGGTGATFASFLASIHPVLSLLGYTVYNMLMCVCVGGPRPGFCVTATLPE